MIGSLDFEPKKAYNINYMATKALPRKPTNTAESVEAKSGGFSDELRSEGKALSKSVLDNFWRELLAGSVKTVSEQVAHVDAKPSSNAPKVKGELAMGEEVSLKKQAQAVDQHGKLLRGQNIEEFGDPNKLLKNELHQEYYRREIANIEVKKDREEEYVIKEQVEKIRSELMQLIKEAKQMDSMVKAVAREAMGAIEKPGRYHLNFLDWLYIQFRNMRVKMQETAPWAKMFASKKAERKYGAMAKKHGTTFSLSQERTTATQTG